MAGNILAEAPAQPNDSTEAEGSGREQSVSTPVEVHRREEHAEHPQAAPEEPPPPLLMVDRSPDPPALISVDSYSMSVQWNPASTTFQSQPGRVLEFTLTYALEMQEVDGNTAQPREDRWSKQYSGPITYVQITGIRPGRNYAVRVHCNPLVEDPEVLVQLAPPSASLFVSTPPTPPSAPAAPTLSVRQRNLLKFKWSEPSESGGHPIQAFVFECYPPPEGHKGHPGLDVRMHADFSDLIRCTIDC
jgi:hypothetical protein